jgi:peptidoglycan/xylan/chitin deacetylase (PgdA/CDA1 family)
MKRVLAVLVSVAAAALVLVGYSISSRPASPPLVHLPAAAAAASKVVYLTFDDGPTAGYTPEVLADLNAAHVHATFFEVGEEMEKTHCVITRQLLASGDQIGSHTWSYPDMVDIGYGLPKTTAARLLMGQKVNEEIVRAEAFQVACTGYNSHLFRYPHFAATNYGNLVLRQNGMVAAYADVSPPDYDSTSTTSDNTIINSTLTQVHNGAVIDLHDGDGTGPELRPHPTYLPELLSLLKAAGYRFATLNANHLPLAASRPRTRPGTS